MMEPKIRFATIEPFQALLILIILSKGKDWVF